MKESVSPAKSGVSGLKYALMSQLRHTIAKLQSDIAQKVLADSKLHIWQISTKRSKEDKTEEVGSSKIALYNKRRL